jgi:hypothetical protein
MKQKLPFIKSSTAIKGFQESTLAKSETNDCVVLSIASAFGVNYDAAHEFVKNTFKRENRKGTRNFPMTLTRYALEHKEIFGTNIVPMGTMTVDKYNYSLRYMVKVGNRLVNRGMTVHTFIKNNPVGTFIVVVKGHAFTIIDGVVVGNYEDSLKKKKIIYDAWEVIF